jgi:hypothetical protein
MLQTNTTINSLYDSFFRCLALQLRQFKRRRIVVKIPNIVGNNNKDILNLLTTSCSE